MKKISLVLFFMVFCFSHLYARDNNIRKLSIEERARIISNFSVQPRSEKPAGSIYAPPEYALSEGVLVTYSSYIKSYFSDIVEGVVSANAIPYIIYKDSYFKDTKNDIINEVLMPADIDEEDVVFLELSHNTYWVRDYAPWFVYENGKRALINHNYKKPGARPDDDNIPSEIGGLWNENVYSTSFFTEGGNFMTDGAGTCWQSSKVFDNWSLSDGGGPKNPGWSEEDVKELFENFLGCEVIIHTPYLPDENTGHIDMFSKIINQDTILVGMSSSEYGASQNQIEFLDNIADVYARTPKPNGEEWNIVRIPMVFENNVYYTYTNSLIVNNTVLVPQYGITSNGFDHDEDALKIYRELMPHHNIKGIYSGDVIKSGGAIHCTTMQVPPREHSRCGNGIIDDDEECEKNYFAGKSCESFGYEYGELRCKDCSFDFSECLKTKPDEDEYPDDYKDDDDSYQDKEKSDSDVFENNENDDYISDDEKFISRESGCSCSMPLF